MPNVKIVGYLCSTAICIVALLTDGITAITLSIAVASTLAGVTGYTAGAIKGKTDV